MTLIGWTAATAPERVRLQPNAPRQHLCDAEQHVGRADAAECHALSPGAPDRSSRCAQEFCGVPILVRWVATRVSVVAIDGSREGLAHTRVNCRVRAYVKFLTQDEDVSRLDDLCADMMGPFHAYVLISVCIGLNGNRLTNSKCCFAGQRAVAATRCLMAPLRPKATAGTRWCWYELLPISSPVDPRLKRCVFI